MPYTSIDELWENEGKFYIRWEHSDGGRWTEEFLTKETYQTALDKNKKEQEQREFERKQADELRHIKARQRNREIANMFTIGNRLREKK